jgi:hypothetical protein
LKRLPEGNWYCPECDPSASNGPASQSKRYISASNLDSEDPSGYGKKKHADKKMPASGKKNEDAFEEDWTPGVTYPYKVGPHQKLIAKKRREQGREVLKARKEAEKMWRMETMDVTFDDSDLGLSFGAVVSVVKRDTCRLAHKQNIIINIYFVFLLGRVSSRNR